MSDLKKFPFKSKFFNSKNFSSSKGIYMLFRESDGRCIYVGRTTERTSSISKRLSKHHSDPTIKLRKCIKSETAKGGKILFSCILMDCKENLEIKKKEAELILKFNTLRYGNAKKGDKFV